MERAITTCLSAALLVTATSVVHADPEVKGLAIATGVLAVVAIATPEHRESDYLAFEAGRFDPIKNVQQANSFEGQYRFGKVPLVEAASADRRRCDIGSQPLYGYAGVGFATYWGDRAVATPTFAVVGYRRGEGKDLGNPPVLGRFGIDLEYRLDNDMRIGLAYHHMSNGKVLGQTNNPGTEVVGLTFAIPL